MISVYMILTMEKTMETTIEGLGFRYPKGYMRVT